MATTIASSVVYDHSELVTRCSAMFSLMNVAEQNSFLLANGITRKTDDGNDRSSNMLVVSPSQDRSKNRIRCDEALRLVSDTKKPGPRNPLEKGPPITDDDLRELFVQMDTNKSGLIDRNEFCATYKKMEWFGGPSKIGWVESEIDRLCGDKTGLDFTQFAHLISHLSPM